MTPPQSPQVEEQKEVTAAISLVDVWHLSAFRNDLLQKCHCIVGLRL